MTEYDRAGEKVSEALEAAEGFGNKSWISELKTFAQPLYLMREGRFPEAVAGSDEGVALAKEIGHLGAECLGMATLSALATMQGRYEDGIRLANQAHDAAIGSGLPWLKSFIFEVSKRRQYQADRELISPREHQTQAVKRDMYHPRIHAHLTPQSGNFHQIAQK